MGFRVLIQPSGVFFEADENESIVESALKNQIALEYSCNNGACGKCKAKLIDGEIDFSDTHSVLNQTEIKEGMFLTCSSKPLSDCVVDAKYFPELEGITQKVIPGKLDSIDFPSQEISVLKFRTPPRTELNYLPGQYFDLIYSGVRRSYSVANSQVSSTGIELHIAKVTKGEMSTKVFEEFKPETMVRLDGPKGTFFVRDSKNPLIFLAGGTGFAPVKAMVEDLIAKGDIREVYIYWGVSKPTNLYSSLPVEWSNTFDNIHFVPVVSGDDVIWSGRKGLVHKAVMADFDSLAEFDVYACGSPLMIDSAQSDFEDLGLPAEQFFSDAFTASTNS
ncbi:2Fe-2S iron-sulfur cluster-binding protein [Corallincola platygyrae]|uniref:2Fe-2S iron-sulfur cluster-binding protein n=1 Tax=Corallincola platygyrae TaxID=1193278 RepID=A0ABW4XI68_9GAMM